jgi:hypothetical protein
MKKLKFHIGQRVEVLRGRRWVRAEIREAESKASANYYVVAFCKSDLVTEDMIRKIPAIKFPVPILPRAATPHQSLNPGLRVMRRKGFLAMRFCFCTESLGVTRFWGRLLGWGRRAGIRPITFGSSP